MASSLSEEASDSSSSGRWGGLGLRRGDWSSPAFFVEGIRVIATVVAVGGGSGTAVRDGLGISSLGAGGVLTPMG